MTQFLEDSDSAEIANAVVLTWQEIELGLCPIIGRRGVSALFKRAVQMTSRIYPWLEDTHEGVNFAALKAALDQQNKDAVIAAGDLLIQTFKDLLIAMVGPSLTERLLDSIATNSFSNASAGP